MPLNLGPFSLERVELAWKMVQDRVRQASAALEKAGIPYAVARLPGVLT